MNFETGIHHYSRYLIFSHSKRISLRLCGFA